VRLRCSLRSGGAVDAGLPRGHLWSLQPHPLDNGGLWQTDATGLQDPDEQPGNSFNGTATSHMVDPAEAASEQSQMFGEPVENLHGAAQVMAWHPVFLECAARNLLDHALRLDTSSPVSRSLLASIGDAAVARSPDPSLADLMMATFSHPEVVHSTLAQLGEGS
jgi:hypothetical protein